jgi:hypothetical protein
MVPQAITPERILFRAQTAALVRVLGQKKGTALLRAMAEDLALAVSLSEVVPILGAGTHSARAEATAEAAASFRADLSTFVAAIPR